MEDKLDLGATGESSFKWMVLSIPLAFARGMHNYTAFLTDIDVFAKNLLVHNYDECCWKIDLFRVPNMVVHILPCWKCCQVYQRLGLFPERRSDFWLF